MAVCSASVIAMLGRVASDHRDALWREQEPSPITGAASAASSDIPARASDRGGRWTTMRRSDA